MVTCRRKRAIETGTPVNPTTIKETVWTAGNSRWLDWKELWRFRELFYFFAWRDIKIKYKQTFLGVAWVILQPLLLMIIFTFFFGRMLKTPTDSMPYPVFIFSGLLMWNTFASSLSGAALGMVNHANIIKKIYFPRLIIPVSAVLVAVFDFVMAFLLFLPMLAWFSQPVEWTALYCWPAALLIAMMASLGPGCLLSALNIKYRDFRYVIPFLLQVLFFLSPILYPASLLPSPLMQYILALSPMYAAIELFRYPLSAGAMEPTLMLISTSSGLFFTIVGVLYFRSTEDFFADFA